MKLYSTRGEAPAVTMSQAIRSGAAPDGGLYMPQDLPRAAPAPGERLPQTAYRLIAPFFDGDPLAHAVEAMCEEALDLDLPLVRPDPEQPRLFALELFHGPTGAFKDFGARFLAAALSRLAEASGERLTVLAATSGDTGGAVGCAVEGRERLAAGILFPKGRVSAFQRHQLCCWAPPVQAFEVDGDFDACQALVKTAFRNPDASARFGLTSANSINIARLLPQAAFLAHGAQAALDETGEIPGLIIPTGNLGHGFAAVLARAMGAPIGPVVLATNANAALSRWAQTGRYEPLASVATIANAMDVGAPSNMERLLDFTESGRAGTAPAVERVSDKAIRVRIRADFNRTGYVWCPHSATAAEAHARLSPEARAARPWVLAATAHPFKFAEIVEPLIGRPVEPSPELAAVLTRPDRSLAVPATLEALTQALAQTESA